MRVFLGLDLPGDLKERLGFLCRGMPDCRWVDPLGFHITLAFLGDVSEDQLEDLDRELTGLEVRPFELCLEGCGVFETGHDPRAVWLGVGGAVDRLHHLHQKCLKACDMAGLKPERRKYTPHVTLGRFKKVPPARLIDFIEAHSRFKSDPFSVTGVSLFRSHLGRKGSSYEIICDY